MRDRLLRIGITRSFAETDFTRQRLDALRDHLLSDEELRPVLTAAGYGSVGVFETDTEADMLRALNSEQFDAAFVPSHVWANQQAGYHVTLQTRRERDIVSPRARMVLQRGVVFLSPRSEFFDRDLESDPQAFADYLATKRVAAVGSQSVAGFVGPLLALHAEFGVTLSGGDILWCRSDAEVVKAVLAGIVDVGVCEEGDLVETLRAAGLDERRDELLRTVVRSRPVPSDPVVFRSALAPETSELGRQLQRSLRAFSLEAGFGTVTLQTAGDSDYNDVRVLLRDFTERVGEIRR